MFMAMLPILFANRTVVADDKNVGVYAVIGATLPSSAPQINSIPDGKTFTTNDSLTVSGTCQNGMQVKIFKNEVLAGSTLCKSGAFSLPIDLFAGSNVVTARDYNADNIAGPESRPIIVKLVAQDVQTNGKFLGTTVDSNLLLTSDAYYRGATAGKTISWLVTVSNGQAPYQISISWGDGKTEKLQRSASGQFKVNHIYDKSAQDSGNYTVIIEAKDKLGQHALLQLVAVVPSVGTSSVGSTSGGANWFTSEVALQAVITTTLIVLSFWIGERYELRLIKHQAASVV